MAIPALAPAAGATTPQKQRRCATE